MLKLMLEIVLGLVIGNAIEWGTHRWILHGLGKRKGSWWSFHWREHHRAARLHDHVDTDYLRSPFANNAQGKEVFALLGGAVLWAPLAIWLPFTYAGLVAHGVLYYVVHRQAHLNGDWARRWLPWHYDHHMAIDQDANWCVTWPLFDWIFRTRVVYYGTERERTDRARRLARSVKPELPSGSATHA